MVISVPAVDDARAVFFALANPETLYVFGVIAAKVVDVRLDEVDQDQGGGAGARFGDAESRCRGCGRGGAGQRLNGPACSRSSSTTRAV